MTLISCKVLFNERGNAISPDEIRAKITKFGGSYQTAMIKTVQRSEKLDRDGEIFIECASLILKNFGMTRRGIFHDALRETLEACWNEVGADLLSINQSVRKSGLSRERYLVLIGERDRRELISKVWFLTKQILPLTMSKSSYGLVGASKILFSVLPEIVLPVDNVQWMQLFKTVDLGDVIQFMAKDIQQWETATGREFNSLGSAPSAMTLPCVYNVMAMNARPKD